MPEDVGKVIAIGLSVPNQIVEDVREILHRTVMTSKRIEVEIVPEYLERKNRASKKWVITHQVAIVPDQIALETGQVDEERRRH